MKIRKTIIIRMISALTIMCTAISMAVFPSYAVDESINSKGNIVLEDGSKDVAFYAADAGYLQDELENLYQELPEISYSQYYGTTRKSALNSKGIIDYANGTVVIDSSDFAYLADEIDSLEAEYKANTVAALNVMGTFFLADGSINHDLEDGGFSEAASGLSFEKIYEGIKQSQSVDHLAEQNISGAIEDNLSKGTAAWVNGELIIGNGADNDAYYQKGIDDVVDNPNDYGISTAPKADYLVTNLGGVSYTIKTDGKYTIHVITTYHQDGSHHAQSCGTYLTIGSEKITVFQNGNNTGYASEGNTNYKITRNLKAGTVVKCSVEDPLITKDDGGSCIYTVASLTIY